MVGLARLLAAHNRLEEDLGLERQGWGRKALLVAQGLEIRLLAFLIRSEEAIVAQHAKAAFLVPVRHLLEQSAWQLLCGWAMDELEDDFQGLLWQHCLGPRRDRDDLVECRLSSYLHHRWHAFLPAAWAKDEEDRVVLRHAIRPERERRLWRCDRWSMLSPQHLGAQSGSSSWMLEPSMACRRA